MKRVPQQAKDLIKQIVAATFRLDGEPAQLTDGQAEIVAAILDPSIKRIWIATTTQYGKTLVLGFACLLALARNDRVERIVLTAPIKEQADIAMNYILEHVLDNPALYEGLTVRRQVERHKTEFSKKRLQWLTGSSIKVISADAKNSSGDINKAGRNLMGTGGTLIIVDEAALINDVIIAKILRMLGANPDAKLVVISNPFNEGFFYQASTDPNYYKIKVDWRQAVAEGRLTTEFVEEMRRLMDPMLFKILYDVDFVIGSTDSYITQELIQAANEAEWDEEEKDINSKLPIKVGIDVARFGRDKSVILVRRGNEILHIYTHQGQSTSNIVGELVRLQEEYKFEWENVAIDDIGVGGGVVDQLRNDGKDVMGVNVAVSPDDNEQYADTTSELWGRIKIAVKAGLKIEDTDLIKQLTNRTYGYTKNANGAVLKLEPKESLKRRGLKSPDIADALALSYYEYNNKYLSALNQLAK